MVSDVADVREESVRFHSVRLIYSVDVADQPLRPAWDGSTDAAHWMPERHVPALPLPDWLRRGFHLHSGDHRLAAPLRPSGRKGRPAASSLGSHQGQVREETDQG